MALITDFLRAAGQLSDGRFVGVLAWSLALTLGLLAGLSLGAVWLVGLLPVSFDLPLIGEVATPMPAAPGQVAHYDYEYVRNGVANIFMIFEPLAGQRDVEVTDRRTKKDYAECLRKISDQIYPDAEVIVLVQDNLNTH